MQKTSCASPSIQEEHGTYPGGNVGAHKWVASIGRFEPFCFSSGQFGIRIRVINPERLHSIELIGGQMLSLATRPNPNPSLGA